MEKSQKVSDYHRNDVSPLTQGLRYRAASDVYRLRPATINKRTEIKYSKQKPQNALKEIRIILEVEPTETGQTSELRIF